MLDHELPGFDHLLHPVEGEVRGLGLHTCRVWLGLSPKSSHCARVSPTSSEGRREIRLEDLPQVVRERVTVGEGDKVLRRRPPRARPEKAEIEALLDRHKGNIAEVARELDRQWAVVWRWVQKSGFDVDKYRR